LEQAGNQPVQARDDVERRILEMHAAGASSRQIEQAVFGHTGGAAYDTVKTVIGRATTTTKQVLPA
jgi:hypothetical protein